MRKRRRRSSTLAVGSIPGIHSLETPLGGEVRGVHGGEGVHGYRQQQEAVINFEITNLKEQNAMGRIVFVLFVNRLVFMALSFVHEKDMKYGRSSTAARRNRSGY